MSKTIQLNEKGVIFDIDYFSTHDGPGIRTAVFLKGCFLKCKWCHSPESQSLQKELLYQRIRCTGCLSCINVCPHSAINIDEKKVDEMTGVTIVRENCQKCFFCVSACNFKAMRQAGTEYFANDLIEKIRGENDFYENSGGGVTITGGEPLMQPKFTLEIILGCRKYGIHTIMETCGYGSEVELKAICEACSAVYYDIKLFDMNKHKEWTNVSNKIILENLEFICASENIAKKIMVRIPCIPTINDDSDNIRKIAEFVYKLKISSIQLMPYNLMAAEKYKWIGKGYSLPDLAPRDNAYYEGLNKVIEYVGVKAIREL